MATAPLYRVNPLLAALDRELGHPHALRQANAYSHIVTALHEAGHAVVGFSFTDWGWITLPFGNPIHATARCCGRTFDEEVMTIWAGCAMDRVTFGHALFAQGDFYRGYQMLVHDCGHDGAAIKAPILMDRVEQIVLELLPAIQAMAFAATPQVMLRDKAFRSEARRAGLQSSSIIKRIGSKGAAKAAAYLALFASTPEQLRRELGMETLLTAHSQLSDAWFRADARSVRIPSCQCGCGKPLLDEDTVCEALIQSWSKRMGGACPICATLGKSFASRHNTSLVPLCEQHHVVYATLA